MVTNYKSNAMATKKLIFESIFKQYKNKENIIKLSKLITDKYPKCITDKYPKCKNSNTKCKVGDQICYTPNDGCHGYNQLIGVVTKINKTTISFKPYKIDRVVSENPDAFSYFAIENRRYYFDKNKFEKVKTVKHFKLDDSDYFERDFDRGR